MNIKNSKLLKILSTYNYDIDKNYKAIILDCKLMFKRNTSLIILTIPSLKLLVVNKTNFLSANITFTTRLVYLINDLTTLLKCCKCGKYVIQNLQLNYDCKNALCVDCTDKLRRSLKIHINHLDIKKLSANNFYYSQNNTYFSLLIQLVNEYPFGYFKYLNGKYSVKQVDGINIAELKNWIIISTLWLNASNYQYKMSYRIGCIIYGLTNFKKCNYKKCNKLMDNPKHFLGIFVGFRLYCSNRCALSDEITLQTISNTLFEHYKVRVKSALQIKDVLEKSQITCTVLYGTSNAGGSSYVQNKTKTRYKYNDKYFHSMPELAYFIYLTDNNIDFLYHGKMSIVYMFENKQHRYYPDFKVNGLYVEIKGDLFFDSNGNMIAPYRSLYKTDADYKHACKHYEAKHLCMILNNVKILRNSDYLQYIDYVETKYGKGYLSSFKNNKHKLSEL